MPTNIELVSKKSLFPHLHARLNMLLRDTSPDSAHAPEGKEKQRFRAPQDHEIEFVYKLCQLLHHECGIGDKSDKADTVQRVANVKDPANLKKYLRLDLEFFTKLCVAMDNPSLNGLGVWIDEKTHPDRVRAVYDLFDQYLDVAKSHMDEERKRGIVQSQELRMYDHMVDLLKDTTERKEMFKSVYDPKHDTGPITAANQTFNKVDVLSSDLRPKVIYFGGKIQQSEEPEYVNRAMRRLKRLLEPCQISTGKYDIYVMTYNNRASWQKSLHMYRHHEDPQHYYSPHAWEVAESYLHPLYADADGNKLSEEKLYQQMSLVTLVGYSYGSNFIQEVRNALVTVMDKMGYDPAVTKKALSMVAAFNFNSVTDVVDKRSRGDFTQAHVTAEDDIGTYLHSNICELTAADKNPILKQYRVEDDRGLHSLALQGIGVSSDVMSFKTHVIDHTDAIDDAGTTIPMTGLRDKEGRTLKVRVIDSAVIRRNERRHHIVDSYRIDGIRKDDGELVVRNNPAAEFLNRAIRRQVETSIAVSRGDLASRNAAHINEEVAHGILTAEKISEKDMSNRQMRTMLQREIDRRRIPLCEDPPSRD
jgi:hypothetical protein